MTMRSLYLICSCHAGTVFLVGRLISLENSPDLWDHSGPWVSLSVTLPASFLSGSETHLFIYGCSSLGHLGFSSSYTCTTQAPPNVSSAFLQLDFSGRPTLSSMRLMQSQQINCTGRKPEAHSPPFSKPTTTAVPASSWDLAKNGTQDRWVRDPVLQALKLSHGAFPHPALEPSLFKTTINQRL